MLWCLLVFLTAVVPAVSKVHVSIDWSTTKVVTKTAATVEVDVMPFLGRTTYGGPFDAYYQAMSNLGAEFVRYAPWFANPRAVVPELEPSDCTSAKPATNWNSSVFDELVSDFMAAVCGPNAVSGECKLSVVQQLSTMPGWMYIGGMKASDLPQYAWNTTDPFDMYSAGDKLVDPTCKQMARYMARLVGHYTAGGHHDECGHWHASGFRYNWWGLSVLNEDEHRIEPDNGEAYTVCFDAIAAEVRKVNGNITLVGPEVTTQSSLDYLLYFLNASHHSDGKPPAVASYHQAQNADNNTAETFFDQWDDTLKNYVMKVESFKKTTGQTTEMVLNEFIPFIGDWCDCLGIEKECGGRRYGRCPSFQHQASAGFEPNLQHRKGIGMNKATWSWHAAAGVFAYGYATLAEFKYKYVGADQLIGGTWPDNEPMVSCMDWQSGQPNAKYWVTQLLATTVGDKSEKTIVKSSVAPASASLHVMAYVHKGKRGVLLINKVASWQSIAIEGVNGGDATVVEVDTEGPNRMEPALVPPVSKRISSDGVLDVGPFGVAVVTNLKFAGTLQYV